MPEADEPFSPARDLAITLADLVAQAVTDRGPAEAIKIVQKALARAEHIAHRIAPWLSRSPSSRSASQVLYRMPLGERWRNDQIAQLARHVRAELADTSALAERADDIDIHQESNLQDAITTVLVGLLIRPQPSATMVTDNARRLLATVVNDQVLLKHLVGERPEEIDLPLPGPTLAVLPVVVLALWIATYLLARFHGHYIEQDTAEMTLLITDVYKFGNAIPSVAVPVVYPSGYGFQAINIYLLRLSGVSIQTIETLVWPFFLAADAFMAFLAFSEMTEDKRTGALAALFLLLQPDFLFTALRGSHEKVTYFLLLTALFLLFRSYHRRTQVRIFAKYVVLFYICMFSIVSINSTFGSSLIVAVTGSFFIGAFIIFFVDNNDSKYRISLIRLGYISGASLLLLFLEIFYFYHPSSGIFNQFRSAMDRLAGFVLNFKAIDNPYAYVSLGWRSVYIYLIITSFTWITLAISGLSWTIRSWRVLFHQKWQHMTDSQRLMWLLYVGLAIQVGVGIAADFSGVLGANLQLRLFPVFMFIAIPTSAKAILAIIDRAGGWLQLHRITRAFTSLSVVFFTVCSVFKATNEPLLSNKWTFYTTPELQAIYWLDEKVPSIPVWADVDERLREVYIFFTQNPLATQRFPLPELPEQVPLVMMSTTTRIRMAQLGVPP
ncbi:MAG: hypothetical protein M1298_03770, partial [Chloroflexi bacterium]|nr:hypothetical protein [Chloroflexota bacterium]